MSDLESLDGSVLDGKYRVGRMLGRGGMGAVFAAEHLGTGRTVAVKVILPQFVSHPEALERFRREARAAGQLRHPNIVDATDFGVATVDGGEVAYLVMEYLEGTTLRAFIDSHGTLQPEVLAAIVEQVALALHAAHSAGMVHRDIKPDNVWLVPDGRGGHIVRVLDFGLAKLRDSAPPAAAVELRPEAPPDTAPPEGGDEDSKATVAFSGTPMPSGAPSPQLTMAGSTLGTPAYMSPEQCRGGMIDHRSDIYSLGVLAYEALAGRRPFSGSFQELIDAHLNSAPERLDRVAGVSANLADAVARSLAKSPEERFPSACAMAGSLYAAIEGPSVLIRRAIGLYADRASLFIRIAARPLLPLLLWLLVPMGPIGFFWPLPAIMFGSLSLWMAMTMLSNAAFGVAIDRLRARPLDRLTAAQVYADLQSRLGLSPDAGMLRLATSLMKFYTAAEMRSPAMAGDLGFLIALLERRPLTEIHDRCLLLKKAAIASYDRIRLLIFAALFILPALEGCVIFAVATALHVARAVPLAFFGATLLIPLNALVFNPISSTGLALLYFRARQANGEDVSISSIIAVRV